MWIAFEAWLAPPSSASQVELYFAGEARILLKLAAVRRDACAGTTVIFCPQFMFQGAKSVFSISYDTFDILQWFVVCV